MEKTIQTAVPVSMLNKVPGFDPLKYAKWSEDEDGHKQVSLALNHKILWFRLCHPSGAFPVQLLRLTSEEAIAEARVSFVRGGPVVSTAQVRMTIHDSCGAKYMEAARRMALDQALTDAGFGIQLSDVVQTSDVVQHTRPQDMGHAAEGSCQNMAAKAPRTKPAQVGPVHESADTPVSEGRGEPPETPAEQSAEVQTAPETTAEPVGDVAAEEPVAEEAAVEQPAEVQTTPETAAEPVGDVAAEKPVSEQAAAEQAAEVQTTPETTTEPVGDVAVEEPVPEETAAEQAAEVQTTPETAAEPVGDVATEEPMAEEAAIEQPAEVQTAPNAGNVVPMDAVQEEDISTGDGRFTEAMPVDEILAQITMEEALAVRIDVGSSEGQTIGMTLERRPATIKWLANGYTGGNNILRAAARYVLEAGMETKAG